MHYNQYQSVITKIIKLRTMRHNGHAPTRNTVYDPVMHTTPVTEQRQVPSIIRRCHACV